MSRLGVDFSEWGGPLTPATVECWKAKGIEHAIVQYSERMEQHLDVLHQVDGLTVEGYVYLYWGVDPWGQLPQLRTIHALKRAGNRIDRLWLDAEDTTHPYDEQQLMECVEICEQAGMPTGIYTGRWWWEPQTGNSVAFAHLPLWHAEYVHAPPDFATFQPYGGWTRPLIWQYEGTTTLCRHSVDLDSIDIVGGEPMEDEERRVKALLCKTIIKDYGARSLGLHPVHGREMVEVTNPDGSETDPRTILAIRS